MHSLFIDETITYDGTQLASLWAYKNFRLQGDSIVAFAGPCNVKLAEMVDQEDVLAGAFIYSENMVHFIVEHFDMDLEKTVTRQRLLIAIMRDMLLEMGVSPTLRRQGDDLYLNDRKASVSIATLSPVSSLIHAAVNISSQNTPVPTIGLADLHIDPVIFAKRVIHAYQNELDSIRMARCKVRGVI
jgi:uncharacterized protein